MKNLKAILIGIIFISSVTYGQENNAINILDGNSDGVLNPYEAMDILFMLQQENEKPLSVSEFNKIATKSQKEDRKELERIFKKYDKDKDGKVIIKDVKDEETRGFMMMMDSDENGKLTKKEALNFNMEKAMLMSAEQIKEQADAIYKELDKNKNGALELSELPEEERDFIEEVDVNNDGKAEKREFIQFMTYNNTPVSFKVKSGVAYMYGVISSDTPAKVLQLIFEHPEVKVIEMVSVPGSINDVANLRAALYIRKFGLSTRLTSTSMVSSGGTDFFLAGVNREVEKGAKIGVHSWGAGPGEQGKDFPKDDPEHQKYLDFYSKVGIPSAFYWYTLEMAPADGMHWMTDSEIVKYKIETK
ncbi:MAG: hypothetical protein N4A72_00555 [Bacteroidales bacterium]|jgi:Ca2+-binding EF-hand superfamily protein|nr:hypothetical protein [Bacteroidales bacterium]